MTRKLPHVSTPITLKLDENVEVTTEYNSITMNHHVTCPLCPRIIRLPGSGTATSFIQHYNACKARSQQAGQATAPPSTSHSGIPATTPSSNTSPASHYLPTSNSTLATCPGQPVVWMPGSIWTTYPYHLHEQSNFPWKPFTIDDVNNTIYFKSDTCLGEGGIINSHVQTCSECRKIPIRGDFRLVEDRAKEVQDHTPWIYRTFQQLNSTMRSMVEQLRHLRTTINNQVRSIQTTTSRIEDYKQMMMMIATQDFCRLKQLISVSLRHGCSAKAIVNRLQRALDGLYSPQGGYTQQELDVSFLAQHIGGPRLLYTLHRSQGLASASTVYRNYNPPLLQPSSGTPSISEITANILAFFTTDLKPLPIPSLDGTLAGNVMMFDGIAIEKKCCYYPTTEKIVGLCREHCRNVSTTVSSEKSIEDIWAALNEIDPIKKVCFGSDATVVAVAPCAQESNYTPLPIVLSPSDKTEKSDQLASWIQVAFDTWNTHGASQYGPLWSIASDGDATFRRARHQLCVYTPLQLNTPLGDILIPLLGLNCYTSKEQITATCDPKHILKRFATLLRGPTGIMLGNIHILPNDVITSLCEVHGISRNEAKDLLDPADKQNVPKAVALLRLIASLGDQESNLPEDEFKREQVLCLAQIGKFFSFFLDPFTLCNMDLGQQLSSLSAYSHIAAALWIEHGADMLTGPLYADCQAVVKNIFFTVARTQLHDPNKKLFLLHEGTDRLERLFSDCRTLDHARNMDIRQLSEKMGIITLINLIYERNPELDKGSRRLSLTNAYGVDHLNPRSWRGNVRVGDVDIALSWKLGREMANSFLTDVFGANKLAMSFNFEKIFCQPNYDLLRPEGQYVGLKPGKGDERSESTTSNNITPPIQPPTNPSQTPSSSNDCDNTRVDVNEGLDESLEFESDTIAFDDAGDLSLEDFIDDEVIADDEEHIRTQKKSRQTIEINGKNVFIDSIVSKISPQYWRSFANRTFRVQGCAIEDYQRSKLSYLVDGDDIATSLYMKAYDVVSCIVYAGEVACLALMVVKGFSSWKGKTKYLHSAMKHSDLIDQKSTTKVYGQLIKLVPSHLLPDYWEWSTEYIGFANIKTNSSKTTKNQSSIGIPSYLVHPLEPSIISHHKSQPHERLRWAISRSALTEQTSILWNKLIGMADNTPPMIHVLPKLKQSEDLPYQYHGRTSYVIENHLYQLPLSSTLGSKQKRGRTFTQSDNTPKGKKRK